MDCAVIFIIPVGRAMTTSVNTFKARRSLVMLLCVLTIAVTACSTTKEKKSIPSQAATATKVTTDTGGTDSANAQPESQAQEVTLEGRNLVLASRFGQLGSVHTMLLEGIDVNSRDELGNTALIAAASAGHADLVTFLLSQGADVNAQSDDGTSALMAAALMGNIDIAKKLLDAGAKVNMQRNNGETALFDAVIYGNNQMARLLLAQGADPDIQSHGDGKNYAGYTPLMYAAGHGVGIQDADWLRMMKILLTNGANPDIANNIDDTALSIAERNGFVDIAEELRKHGARNEIQYAGLGRDEALIKAARLNDVAKAKELLGGAAKPNYRNNITGVTSLLAAAFYGHADIVQLLIEHGADVNNVPWGLTDQRIASSGVPVNEMGLLHAAADGDTALITVIRNNYPDISRVLLDHGADVDVPNRNDELPAYLAARLGRAKIMGELLASGADPNRSQPVERNDRFIMDVNGKEEKRPLLIVATMNGHADTVQELLTADADPNLGDKEDKTALYWAASQGFLNIVKILLTHNADPNINNDIGTTPLMAASKNGYLKIVELLLDNGADINAIEGIEPEFGAGGRKAGNTALIYAARGGHTGIVRLLLTKGADAGLTTDSGESALQAAKSNDHSDVVKILTGSRFN